MKNRKAFNFYRSYYDAFFKLPESDRLPFITALLRKQFENIDPINLEGMADLAYCVTRHSIQSQVDGFLSKTNTPTKGATKGATVQEKEKEKVEEQVKEKVKEQEQEKVQVQEDGREKDLQACISIALKDEKWLRLNSTNKKELDRFALKLQTEGIYSKLPIDFKTHFSRWKKKMPHELQDENIKPKRLYAQDFDTEAEYQTYLKSIA